MIVQLELKKNNYHARDSLHSKDDDRGISDLISSMLPNIEILMSGIFGFLRLDILLARVALLESNEDFSELIPEVDENEAK